MDNSQIPVIEIFSEEESSSSDDTPSHSNDPPQDPQYHPDPPPQQSSKKFKPSDQASLNEDNSNDSRSLSDVSCAPSTSRGFRSRQNGTPSYRTLRQLPERLRRNTATYSAAGNASIGQIPQDNGHFSSTDSNSTTSTQAGRMNDALDNDHYRVSRIVNWKIDDDGLIRFFVEWQEYPGENTWETVTEVGGTEALENFETKLAECLDTITDQTEKHTEKTAQKILLQFTESFNRLCGLKKMAFLKLLMPELIVSDLLESVKRNADKVKRLDKGFNQLRIRFMSFTDPSYNSYSHEGKDCQLTFRALLFMLFKTLKTTDLTNIIKAEAKAAESKKVSDARLERLKAKASQDCDVSFENEVDFDPLPIFKYTSGYLAKDQDQNEQLEPVQVKCDENCCCTQDNTPIKCNCLLYAENVKERFNSIYSNKKIIENFNSNVLYECNHACGCGTKCRNRLTQMKTSHSFCIFKTEEKGWGVKTLSAISRGSFVFKMAGELIPVEQFIADHQGKEELNTYAYVLDGVSIDPSLNMVVDCQKVGNITRFLNHSCSPNLVPYFVFSGNYDVNRPYVAFFASKNIEVNTELTFWYPEQYWWNRCEKCTIVKCNCKSSKCRKLVAGKVNWISESVNNQP